MPRPPAPSAAGSYGPEPSASPSALETEALDLVRARLSGPEGPPRTSAALVLAARELASRSAAGDPDPLSRSSLRAALTSALSFDSAPTAHLVVTSAARAPSVLAGRLSRAAEGPVTHLGAGAALHGERTHLVVLAARRAARLRPFPREVAPGSTVALEGELVGLSKPGVHVTAPSGTSREISLRLSGARPRAFNASIPFTTPGRWIVEVVGSGPGGPEVAALLTVSAGGAPLAEAAAGPDEQDPESLPGAEGRVLVAVNAARTEQGLAPLAMDPRLAEVARRHSEAMLARGALAHVLPGSGDVGDRLRRAGIPFARVAENVARGASALAAHRAIEESPAHRENVLWRAATRIGCGVARGRLSGGEAIAYLTEIFTELPYTAGEDSMTPDVRVREALWRERARLGLPSLVADAALDELARETARRMARSGDPESGAELAGRALALPRKLVAADRFLASGPEEAARSKSLSNGRLRRVGVGVTASAGEHAQVGALYIAVVYTD